MVIKEIQSRFEEANMAFTNLENEIKVNYNTPEDNINLINYSLINIPTGYIRTAEHYRSDYHLRILVSETNAVKNISYALMLSDLNNYFINRFNIYGVMKNLFIKQSIINLIAVSEGILYGTTENLRNFCVKDGITCKYAGKCPVYLKSRNKISFNELLEMLHNKLNFGSDNFTNALMKLRDIRDNIHIQDVEFNEWAEKERYSIKNHNRAIEVLQYIKENLIYKYDEFKERRKVDCIMLKKK